MQVDDFAAAGGRVQSVDVLGDEQLDEPHRLELRERAMRGIRQRLRNDGPAHGTARPVALAHLEARHERAELHGSRAFPLALFVAVIGNAGAGAHARSGEHRETRMTFDEFAELGHGRLLSTFSAPASGAPTLPECPEPPRRCRASSQKSSETF